MEKSSSVLKSSHGWNQLYAEIFVDRPCYVEATQYLKMGNTAQEGYCCKEYVFIDLSTLVTIQGNHRIHSNSRKSSLPDWKPRLDFLSTTCKYLLGQLVLRDVFFTGTHLYLRARECRVNNVVGKY
jgi:hypothetical protein